MADETLDAFVKSIHTLDTSRRVGWAKLFAALDRLELLEAENNRLSEDNKLLSMVCGFSYGVLKSVGMQGIYKKYLRGNLQSLDSQFSQGAINAGIKKGAEWRDRLPLNIERAAKSEFHNLGFEAGGRKCRQLLAAEFGFADESELLAFLGTYRGDPA